MKRLEDIIAQEHWSKEISCSKSRHIMDPYNYVDVALSAFIVECTVMLWELYFVTLAGF